MVSKEKATGGKPVAITEGKATNDNFVLPYCSTNGDDMTSQFDDELDDLLLDSMTPAAELQAEQTEGEAESLRFKPLTFAELLARPPKQWLVDQVFGPGDLIMLYGPPGCGKTFIMVDMIFSVSLSRQFARRFDTVRPLNVAYCAGEGVGGLSQRFAAAAAFYQTDNLPGFAFYENVPQLFGNDGDTMERFIIEQLARQEQGAPAIDLLVIDTLHSASVGAEENSAKDMGVVRDTCLRAARALGCAVMLAHHTNKAGSGERGSSSLRGAMDCMIELKEYGQKYAMHCAKLKDGEAWKPQPFDLIEAAEEIESVRVWWDDPAEMEAAKGSASDEVLELMKGQPGHTFKSGAIASAIGKTQNATNKLLNALVKQGKIGRDMEDGDKPKSPSNPWVYVFKDLGDDEGEIGEALI